MVCNFWIVFYKLKSTIDMKCKGRIIFSGELFKLDIQSEEKVNAAPGENM